MKLTLDGETFDYEPKRQPMSEALAIEKVYKRRFAQWQEDLTGGSAEALAVLAWVIWRRDGRDVPYQDIIDGKVDFDLSELLASMGESAAAEAAAAAEVEKEPDPTTAGPPHPAGTPSTRRGTKGSSPST